MAVVTVEREEAVERGWSFLVRVESGAEHDSTHTVRIDWADYDRWTGGRVPPAHVAEGLVRVTLQGTPPHRLPRTIDASRLRRERPDLDQRIGPLIRD